MVWSNRFWYAPSSARRVDTLPIAVSSAPIPAVAPAAPVETAKAFAGTADSVRPAMVRSPLTVAMLSVFDGPLIVTSPWSPNSTLSPLPPKAASAAITALDSAIKTVSSTRADLGAMQNRFDHTINNLNVTVENLTASESRIRDADMAQEMVQFTRNQILSQAGTAMLAQANQASQGVLSLLR